MEATCEYESMEDQSRVLTVCGAPIPRLCAYRFWHHACGRKPEQHAAPGHEYEAGPLASECTRGHPVVVPTEAERRG